MAVFSQVTPAWSHGGGPSLSYDPCARRAGLYYVHFTAYQPQFNQFEEYCSDIPRAGNTIVVLDLVDKELREVPVGVDIIERAGGKEATILSVPATLYPSGTLRFDVELKPAGNYTAVVTVGEQQRSYRLSFPVSVRVWWSSMTTVAGLALLVIAAATTYCLRQRKLMLAEKRGEQTRSRLRLVSNA